MKMKKMILMSVAFLLPIVFLSHAGAGQFEVRKVADLNTKIGGEFFAEFSEAAISGSDVVFRGLGSWNDGVYLFKNGKTLGRVADKNTKMPGGIGGEQFESFGEPVISGKRVAFTGNGFWGGKGVYCFDGLRLNMVADGNMVIPGKSVNFSHFGYPVISDANVAFTGGDLSSVEGIYLFDGASRSLGEIADQNTLMPPSTIDYFTFFYWPAISGSNIAFHGGGGPGQQGAFLYEGGILSRISGLYKINERSVIISGEYVAFQAENWSLHLYDGYNHTPLITVVDSNTPIPNGGGELFSGAGDAAFSISGSKVAFLGFGQVARDGIYVFDGATGILTEVACTSTLIPGTSEEFVCFDDPAIDGDSVVFWGESRAGHSGIYSFDMSTSTLCTVADATTPIPNGAGNFTFFRTTPSISDKNVVFSGFGVSGQQGIYLALAVPNLTVTGIDISPAPPYSTDDNLYVGWEVTNNGSVPTSTVYYSYVYVDGTYKTYRQQPVLRAGDSHSISDVFIGKLSAGTHNIKVVVDLRNQIAEGDEDDNEFIKEITIQGAPKPNLVPSNPDGGAAKIIVSKKKGTNQDDSSLSATDPLYVDWAVSNSGAGSTSSGFYSYLYVDGNRKAYKYHPPLNPGDSMSVLDASIGTLSAGFHVIKLVIDPGKQISEDDEGDNECARTITIGGAAQPNLVPFKLDGWSDKIVVSNRTGTHTDVVSLLPKDNLYIDWGVGNIGLGATLSGFVSYLYVDGVLKTTQEHPQLGAGSSASALDKSVGMLPSGTHEIRVVVDPQNKIAESDDADNVHVKTITIQNEPLPNLTCFKPDGWSDKIVVSKRTGTDSDDSPLSSTDNLYVDWAVANDGEGPVSSGFLSYLYVDGVYKTYREHGLLNPGVSTTSLDRSIGRLAGGQHEIKIVIDPANRIVESAEGDNICVKTITIQ